VVGEVENILCRDDKLLLISFNDCTATYRDELLFKPEWGRYDMAVGAKVVSVFAGAADKDAYQQPALVPKERTIKVSYSDRELKLHELYQQVRDSREQHKHPNQLPQVWQTLQAEYPDQWLLPLEILEIFRTEGIHDAVADEIESFLRHRAGSEENLTKLIDDGLRLLGRMSPA
jgi:phenylalanine-4-hydroxylase